MVADVEDVEEEALLPNDDSIVTLSERGYIKRMPLSTFAEQNRGTRGKVGVLLDFKDPVKLRREGTHTVGEDRG